MSTPGRAQPFPGPKLYQERAERALPLLVQQAELRREITYGDLARLLGMAHHRPLNYVLGSIGNTLIELGKTWGDEIPPIQSITVNAGTRLPGKGGKWFVGGDQLIARNSTDQRAIIQDAFKKIFGYPRWPEVLRALKLSAAKEIPAGLTGGSTGFNPRGGESKAHKDFKTWISKNPEKIGLKGQWDVEIEHLLNSGDRVDVVFTHRSKIVAVEVKSRISPVEDITRGLYQTIKYRAVLEAQEGLSSSPKSIRSILVTERQLSDDNFRIKAALGLEAMEVKIDET